MLTKALQTPRTGISSPRARRDFDSLAGLVIGTAHTHQPL